MKAVWDIIGGFAGILRMIIAGAIVALAIIGYFVWHVIPDREEAARSGYVLLTRATTAESERDLLKQQLGAQQTVINAYQVQYRNSMEKLAQADAEDDARIACYEAKTQGSDKLTADDVDFIMRRRSAAQTAEGGC